MVSDRIQNGDNSGRRVDRLGGSANNGQTQPRGQNTVTSQVMCGNNVVGSMFFQFGGWTGKTFPDGSGSNRSGMLIRGGFTFANAWTTANNVEFRSTQAYRDTLWDGTVRNYTIDSTGPNGTDPLYPVYTVPTSAGAGNMTPGLYDGPNDFEGSSIAQVDFESVLVCINSANRNLIHMIGSFVWGYRHTGSQALGSTGIDSTYAFAFTPRVTANFTTAFDREFGRGGTKGGGTVWTRDTNCMSCFAQTPEPPMFATMGIGLLPMLLGFVARRKKCSP